MHVLDEIFASLRLNGGVEFDTRTTGDWCVIAQMTPEDCAPYFPIPLDIICYHYVRKGRIFSQIQGEEVIELRRDR